MWHNASVATIVVDGRPGLATPNFRMLMLAECAGLFFLCGLLFYGLTDHRFVRRGLLPQKLSLWSLLPQELPRWPRSRNRRWRRPSALPPRTVRVQRSQDRGPLEPRTFDRSAPNGLREVQAGGEPFETWGASGEEDC